MGLSRKGRETLERHEKQRLERYMRYLCKREKAGEITPERKEWLELVALAAGAPRRPIGHQPPHVPRLGSRERIR